MRPAEEARGHLAPRKMAIVDPRSGQVRLAGAEALVEVLAPGDLIVVNDAATLPASLRVSGEELEVRLLQRDPDGTWDAALLGRGDWRTPTELRPAPREVGVGERLDFAGGLSARVLARHPEHPRRIRLGFEQQGPSFWRGLYLGGRPVQYSHLGAPLALWDVQTAYAGRPWALEAPSAGHALSWELLLALRRRGVAVARLTHACGLSSTGEPLLDAALPIRERYEIPEETLAEIQRTRRAGGRVIAIGTSVVRALESWALGGERAGWTSLRIGPQHRLRAVDGILSGVHQEGESHHALLQAFAPAPLLAATVQRAEQAGFLNHEYGDLTLVLPGAAEAVALGPSTATRATNPDGAGRCLSGARPGARGRRSRCPAAA